MVNFGYVFGCVPVKEDITWTKEDEASRRDEQCKYRKQNKVPDER